MPILLDLIRKNIQNKKIVPKAINPSKPEDKTIQSSDQLIASAELTLNKLKLLNQSMNLINLS